MAANIILADLKQTILCRSHPFQIGCRPDVIVSLTACSHPFVYHSPFNLIAIKLKRHINYFVSSCLFVNGVLIKFFYVYLSH